MSAWKVVFIPRKRLVAGEQSVSLSENSSNYVTDD